VLRCPTDDKKIVEMRGKYYIIVLNKRLFKKSSAQMELPFNNVPKPDSSYVGDFTPRLDGKAAHSFPSKTSVEASVGNGGVVSQSNKLSSSISHTNKDKPKRSGVKIVTYLNVYRLKCFFLIEERILS
jgi:hypothetical protein